MLIRSYNKQISYSLLICSYVFFYFIRCSEAAIGVLTSNDFEIVVEDTPVELNSTEANYVVASTKDFLDSRLDLSISGYGSSNLAQIVDPVFVTDYQGRREMDTAKVHARSANVIYSNRYKKLRIRRTLQNERFVTIFTFRLTATVESSTDEELQEIDFDKEIRDAFFSDTSDLILIISNAGFINLDKIYLIQYLDGSGAPSSMPSALPTVMPTISLTGEPSTNPNFRPSKLSTVVPSSKPNSEPMLNPMPSPISLHSNLPSISPSIDLPGDNGSNESLWPIIGIAGGACALIVIGSTYIYKRKKPGEKNHSHAEVNEEVVWPINHTYSSSSPPPVLIIKSTPVTEDEFTKEWDANLTFDFSAADEFRDTNIFMNELNSDNEVQEEELSFTDLPKKDDELDKLAASQEMNENESVKSTGVNSDSSHMNFPVTAVEQNYFEPSNDPLNISDRLSIRGEAIETSDDRHKPNPIDEGSFPVIDYQPDEQGLTGAFPRSTPPRENKLSTQNHFPASQFSDESFSHGDTTMSFMHPNDWSNTSYGDDIVYGADDGIKKLSNDVQSKVSVNTGGSSGTHHLIKDLVWLEKRIADHKRLSTVKLYPQSPPSE